jgi:hypothetical protein
MYFSCSFKSQMRMCKIGDGIIGPETLWLVPLPAAVATHPCESRQLDLNDYSTRKNLFKQVIERNP